MNDCKSMLHNKGMQCGKMNYAIRFLVNVTHISSCMHYSYYYPSNSRMLWKILDEIIEMIFSSDVNVKYVYILQFIEEIKYEIETL